MKLKYNKKEEKSDNIVHTYYEDFGWGRNWMLDAWEKSWRKNGWEPKILGPEDAKKHPKYEEILTKINTMPTVNDRRYENACYLRWVAMAYIGGLMTDMDVINISYKPPCNYIKKILVYNKNYIPCMVSGSKESYEEVIDWMLEWNSSPVYRMHGLFHVSDMYLFSFHKPLIGYPLCEEYNNYTSSIIHCSCEASGKDRKKIIESLL